MPNVITSGEFAVLSANSTSTSFSLTEGFSSIAVLKAAGYGVVPLAVASSQTDSNNATVQSYGAVKLRVFGTGADNSTLSVRVWAYSPSGSSSGYVTCVGEIAATLGTLFGSSSTAISSTNRIADGVTFALSSTSSSPTGPWTEIYSSLAAEAATYSPANNTSAYIVLPELGSATYLIFDFDMTGATSGNVAVELLS